VIEIEIHMGTETEIQSTHGTIGIIQQHTGDEVEVGVEEEAGVEEEEVLERGTIVIVTVIGEEVIVGV
jgi:hypothetical protein